MIDVLEEFYIMFSKNEPIFGKKRQLRPLNGNNEPLFGRKSNIQSQPAITSTSPTKEKGDRLSYSTKVDTARQDFLTSSTTASLLVLNASDHGYRLVGKEKLLAVQNDAVRMEMKSTGYSTAGMSISIPIVKGVRFRVGGGNIQTKKSWQETAHGRLLVTDKAIVFESSLKNERITWTQVADIELLTDGYSIAKRNGPPRNYKVASPNPEFAAIVDLMLSRVA